jgi:hypothetical protein
MPGQRVSLVTLREPLSFFPQETTRSTLSSGNSAKMPAPVIPNTENSYAVLIGSSRYDALPGLPSVGNNVAALRRLLTDRRVWGIPAENCIVIENPSSPVELVKPIATALAQARDCFLLYFAGHGFLDEQSELCLAITGSDGQNSYSGVPYDLIRRELRKKKPMRTLVILDCCYSGRAASAQGATQALTEEAEVRGTYLIAASAPTKKALSPPGERYTAFTGTLINVLENGIPSEYDILRITDIYEEVRRRLDKDKRPLPEAHAYNLAGSIGFRNRFEAPKAAITGESSAPRPAAEETRQEDPGPIEPFTGGRLPSRLHWQSAAGADSPFALRLNAAARELSLEVHKRIDSELQSIPREDFLKIEWDNAASALMGEWSDIRHHYRPAEKRTSTERFAQAPIDLSGGTNDVASVLEMLPSGRLAFLGGPGSGKTTVLKLACQELNYWASQSNGPVPVLLDISDWNAQRQSFRDWLIRDLRREFTAARGLISASGLTATATALVDTGRVYPVLDNFDEMSAVQRKAALHQLGVSSLPFLLASRLDEYAESVVTTEPPKATAAVVLRDLEDTQAGALSTPRMASLLKKARKNNLDQKNDPSLYLDHSKYVDANSIEESLLSSSLDTSAESFIVRAYSYFNSPMATQLSWWLPGGKERLRLNAAWCGIPAGLLAMIFAFVLALPAWPAPLASLFAVGFGLIAAAFATYSSRRVSIRISRRPPNSWSASYGVGSVRRAAGFGALVGGVLGATGSLSIALSSFSPSRIVTQTYYYSYYYPLVSSNDAVSVILGTAFVTAILTALAAAGATCLEEFIRPDRHAIAKQMFKTARYVALLRFALIALLSGLVVGEAGTAAYEDSGLGLLDGISFGLLYGFLIGLAPSSWYRALFTHRGLMRRAGDPVKYLETSRSRGLVRRAGCDFELADHRLISIVTSRREATGDTQAEESTAT